MPESTTDSLDSGLACLVLLLRFNGVAAEAEQIGHRLGGVPVGVPDMLRCAKAFGLKARVVTKEWSRLAATALPAIAQRIDGSFLILGKVVDDNVLIQDPVSGRPLMIARKEFEATWSGQLVVMTRRASLAELV